jgi:Sigma-70, region 4
VALRAKRAAEDAAWIDVGERPEPREPKAPRWTRPDWTEPTDAKTWAIEMLYQLRLATPPGSKGTPIEPLNEYQSRAIAAVWDAAQTADLTWDRERSMRHAWGHIQGANRREQYEHRGTWTVLNRNHPGEAIVPTPGGKASERLVTDLNALVERAARTVSTRYGGNRLPNDLTPAEIEVLALRKRGDTWGEIAARRGTSRSTVKNIYRRAVKKDEGIHLNRL